MNCVSTSKEAGPHDYLLKLIEMVKDYGYEIKIDTWFGIIIYW